jgi:hypothetical protein
MSSVRRVRLLWHHRHPVSHSKATRRYLLWVIPVHSCRGYIVFVDGSIISVEAIDDCGPGLDRVPRSYVLYKDHSGSRLDRRSMLVWKFCLVNCSWIPSSDLPVLQVQPPAAEAGFTEDAVQYHPAVSNPLLPVHMKADILTPRDSCSGYTITALMV